MTGLIVEQLYRFCINGYFICYLEKSDDQTHEVLRDETINISDVSKYPICNSSSIISTKVEHSLSTAEYIMFFYRRVVKNIKINSKLNKYLTTEHHYRNKAKSLFNVYCIS